MPTDNTITVNLLASSIFDEMAATTSSTLLMQRQHQAASSCGGAPSSSSSPVMMASSAVAAGPATAALIQAMTNLHQITQQVQATQELIRQCLRFQGQVPGVACGGGFNASDGAGKININTISPQTTTTTTTPSVRFPESVDRDLSEREKKKKATTSGSNINNLDRWQDSMASMPSLAGMETSDDSIISPAVKERGTRRRPPPPQDDDNNNDNNCDDGIDQDQDADQDDDDIDGSIHEIISILEDPKKSSSTTAAPPPLLGGGGGGGGEGIDESLTTNHEESMTNFLPGLLLQQQQKGGCATVVDTTNHTYAQEISNTSLTLSGTGDSFISHTESHYEEDNHHDHHDHSDSEHPVVRSVNVGVKDDNHHHHLHHPINIEEDDITSHPDCSEETETATATDRSISPKSNKSSNNKLSSSPPMMDQSMDESIVPPLLDQSMDGIPAPVSPQPTTMDMKLSQSLGVIPPLSPDGSPTEKLPRSSSGPDLLRGLHPDRKSPSGSSGNITTSRKIRRFFSSKMSRMLDDSRESVSSQKSFLSGTKSLGSNGGTSTTTTRTPRRSSRGSRRQQQQKRSSAAHSPPPPATRRNYSYNSQNDDDNATANSSSRYSKSSTTRRTKSSYALLSGWSSSKSRSSRSLRGKPRRSQSGSYHRNSHIQQHHNNLTTLNIFCSSDMVSNDHIMDKLEQLKNNTNYVTVELEDCLTSPQPQPQPNANNVLDLDLTQKSNSNNNTKSIPHALKEILDYGDRHWKCIRMVDELLDGWTYPTFKASRKQFVQELGLDDNDDDDSNNNNDGDDGNDEDGKENGNSNVPICFRTRIQLSDSVDSSSRHLVTGGHGCGGGGSEGAGGGDPLQQQQQQPNDQLTLTQLIEEFQKDSGIIKLVLSATSEPSLELLQALTKLLQCDDRDWEDFVLRLGSDYEAQQAVWPQAVREAIQSLEEASRSKGVTGPSHSP